MHLKRLMKPENESELGIERCLGEIERLCFGGGGVSTELGRVAIFGGDGDDLRAVARK